MSDHVHLKKIILTCHAFYITLNKHVFSFRGQRVDEWAADDTAKGASTAVRGRQDRAGQDPNTENDRNDR